MARKAFVDSNPELKTERSTAGFRIILAAALSASFAAHIHAIGHAADFSLNYIGQQIVPNKTSFLRTTVGGLSSLDYNPLTDRYLAISDDRSKTNPARFYELSLDLAQFQRSPTPGMAGVAFHDVTTIQQPGGGAFKSNAVDPEGLRLDTVRNKIYWSNEGQRGILGFHNPTVREMNPDGSHSRDFEVPAYYHPVGSNMGLFPGDRGIYNNLAFESLAISVDGDTLYTATENGLIQDTPPSNIVTGSRSRILSFDIASGKPGAEYIYDVEPVVFAPASLIGLATNGLTDFVAIGDRQFITIERSFTLGAATPGNTATGYTVRLYYADARNATDISGMRSIAGKSIQPVRKTLLLDLSDLRNTDGSALAIGNIEGITLGPRFNGKRTLVLVADNNFTRNQLTQFVALEIVPPFERINRLAPIFHMRGAQF
ncbi:esterase-like activity of phytase family protein [Nitrosospira sp. NpAV]|uniref:esterase-like activity of phytase family protein n=1 Tax=Nitrosospira sp. NpAV TaxID=58133 RepID=UPI0009FE66FE|nr:esterase-like activity of phytase family protein [Nitrosospira sp. NpAV]